MALDIVSPARRLAAAILVAGMLLPPVGCRREAPPSPLPNVLLISLDTCRADRLGTYGYRLNTSPFLDRLAREGSLFRRAFINTHGTTPSHTTILSGLYQESHRVEYEGVTSPHEITPLPPGVLLLPDALRGQGYEALAVTDGGRLSRTHGFDMGFDLYDGRGGGVLSGTRKLIDYLEQRIGADERPAFVFYHTYAIHAPYAPPGSWSGYFGWEEGDFEPSVENIHKHVKSARRTLTGDQLEQLIAMYDAGVLHTDMVIQWLFSRLEQIGFLDNCLIVVTSDHGEELGEHGGLSHRKLLYDELVAVPLIFAGTGIPRGRIFRHLATSLDIGPTIMARLGLDTPELMNGHDLFNPSPAAHPREVFAQYGRSRYCIRTLRWKLIESTMTGQLELYDLQRDPAETRNLARKRPGVARQLKQRLDNWRDGQQPFVTGGEAATVQASEETANQLRALGYVQ